MSLDKELICKLNSKSYLLASGYLKDVISKTSLDDDEILAILNLSNKLIISEFLNLQPKFSQSNLLTIERFVNKNLNHRNKLFVSDLIEFATDFNLSINYKKCIQLLKKQNSNNHYILMSAMEYLFFNFKINYVSEILDGFEFILKNRTIDLSARIKAGFYLFRITHRNTYLTTLKKIVGSDSYNKEILNNLLKISANKQKYFEGYKTTLELTR